VAFLTLLGPWSAVPVSRASQMGRLTTMLERNGLLEDGVAVRAPNEVSLEDRRQIGAALVYLMSTHGSKSLVPLLGEELAATDSTGRTEPVREWEATDRVRLAMSELGMAYVGRYDAGGLGNEGYFTLQSNPRPEAVEVAGYDYVIEASNGMDVVVAGRPLHFELDGLDVVVEEAENEIARVSLADAVERGLEEVGEGNQTLPLSEELRIEGRGRAGVRVAMIVRWIGGRRTDGATELTGANGVWLFRFGEGAELPAAEADSTN
jgi:hypothetical protein